MSVKRYWMESKLTQVVSLVCFTSFNQVTFLAQIRMCDLLVFNFEAWNVAWACFQVNVSGVLFRVSRNTR